MKNKLINCVDKERHPQELLSCKVISSLEKLLPRDSYQTFSVVGSQPELLEPQTDIDLVFVTRSEHKNQFLDSLLHACEELTSRHPSLTHSFRIGPIKDQYKALLHCLVYTSDSELTNNPRENIRNEHPGVLRSFSQSERIIRGRSITTYLTQETLQDKEAIAEKRMRDKERASTCKDWTTASSLCWNKDSQGNWRLEREEKTLTDWEKNNLSQYYKKAANNF